MEMYFNPTAFAIILGYYFLINVALYLTMSVDKKRAQKDGWRVP